MDMRPLSISILPIGLLREDWVKQHRPLTNDVNYRIMIHRFNEVLENDESLGNLCAAVHLQI